MLKEVADLWVEALRSGRYKQTTGQLRDENGYCCLGVLCDLHAQQTGKGEWNARGYYMADGGSDHMILPLAVASWAQVSYRTPEVKYKHADYLSVESLPGLNDGQGVSFSEMADLIEAQWEEM